MPYFFERIPFGEQPEEIWNHTGMFEILHLPKAKYNVRTFLNIGILTFILLAIPFYFLLKPLYLHIGNPDFLIGYSVLIAIVFAGLECYNGKYLEKLLKGLSTASFLHHLHPTELVYLKTQKLQNVLHGTIDQLIKEKNISINSNNTLQVSHAEGAKRLEEKVIIETLKNCNYLAPCECG